MTRTPSAKVNFKDVVRGLREAGAFTDYDAPFDTATIDSELKPIHKPGDLAYDHGHRWLLYHQVNLPQALIDDQRKSIFDAINIYMPASIVRQWMHEYFSGDFLRSQSFRYVLDNVNLPSAYLCSVLDDKFSFNLATPERSVDDRQLFTTAERKKISEICERHPELTATIIAYQASYVGYAMKLEGELHFLNMDLGWAEKKRVLEITKFFKETWASDNFVNSILPAVALQYYKNHDGDMAAPFTQEDFKQGMLFASRNGAFRHHIKAPDEAVRLFTCPAQPLIVKASASNIEGTTKASECSVTANAGMAIFQIYKNIKAQVEEGKPQALSVMSTIRQNAQAAQVPPRG